MLSGALASAEERHYGVWPSQVLLPVASWKQWTVKVSVVFVAAFAIGAFLGDVEASRWRFGYWTNVSVSLPVFTVGAAALSLYVSSMSSRGVIALMVSVGAVCLWTITALILMGTFGSRIFSMAWQVFYSEISPASITNQTAGVVGALAGWMLLALPIVTLAWLGLTNHRRLDHPVRLVRRQIAVIALVSVVSFAGTAISAAFEDAVKSRNIRSRAGQSSSEPISQPDAWQERQPATARLGQPWPIGVRVVDEFGGDVAGIVAVEQIDHFDIDLPPVVRPAGAEGHPHVHARKDGQARRVEVR
jgi:hypothetical protein